jgi:putative DNA primase/helicase
MDDINDFLSEAAHIVTDDNPLEPTDTEARAIAVREVRGVIRSRRKKKPRRQLEHIPPEKVAASFLRSQVSGGALTIRFYRDAVWKWAGGRYVELSDSDIRGDVTKWLQHRFERITKGAVGNVLLNVQAGCAVSSRLDMPCWLDGGDRDANPWKLNEVLVTRSQVVHLPSLFDGLDRFVVPSGPKFFNAIATDYDIDLKAPKPERWLRFLDELFGDDRESVRLLQEWLGYLLTRDTKQQKILLMVGPPRSGKGTIGRIIKSLVGDGNCCAPTLSQLASEFGMSSLLNKTAAIIGDARLSARHDLAQVTERLLSVSGEDLQTINRKHKELVTARLPVRFVIVSNELPRFSDASGALASRLSILKFTRSFLGQEDKGLETELDREKAGIVLWALQGWKLLRDAGRFIEPTSSGALVEQMADIASPITSFVDELCVLDAGRSIATDVLYQSFRQWSEKNGIDRPVSKPIFSRDLQAAFPKLLTVRQRVGAAREYRISGIGLAEGGEGWR